MRMAIVIFLAMERSTLPPHSVQHSKFKGKYMKRPLCHLAFSLLLGICSNLVCAQSTTTSNPAVQAAQNQQAIADAQLKIQQDQQAQLTGMLPSSSATPNNGAYTVSGTNPFPSQKLAYDQ